MQQIKQLRLFLPALVLALSFVAAIPAFAEGGTSSGSGSTEPKTTTEPPKTPTPAPAPSPEPKSGGSTETHKSGTEPAPAPKTATPKPDGETNDSSNATELHKQGEDKVAEMRKEKKTEVKQEDRQKRCETHKQGLETKFAKIVANSQRSQARIDEILAKAQAFQASKNLSPVDFSALVATATSARTTSAAAISALQAVQPTLDCANPNVANDVATFKAAAEQTRTALKDYKAAVKNVLTSLKAAANSTTDTTAKPTTGGTN